jgi:hypothetical protein
MPSTRRRDAELGIDRETPVKILGLKMGLEATANVVDFMAEHWGRAPPKKIPMP